MQVTTPLATAADLARRYRLYSRHLKQDVVWSKLLHAIRDKVSWKPWTIGMLQQQSEVKVPADRQTDAYVEWLYPPVTGLLPEDYVLFVPGTQEGFRGQGNLAWSRANRQWLGLEDSRTPISESTSTVIPRPEGEREDGMGMILSPFTGQLVKTGRRNELSRRSANATIPKERWAEPLELFEIDEVEAVEEILGPGSARGLVASLPLSLRSLVSTAGRGHHGVGRKSEWLTQNIDSLKWLLALLGFDPSTHASTQITRPPGFRRPTKDQEGHLAKQTLVGLYRCNGALDPASPFQDWEGFSGWVVDQCVDLNLAGEVDRLAAQAGEGKVTTKTHTLGRPKRRKPTGPTKTQSGSLAMEGHQMSYSMAKEAIKAGQWKTGHSIPPALLERISHATGLTNAEIVERFHNCDPFGPGHLGLFGLGAVPERRVYVGGRGPGGRFLIPTRALPPRQMEPHLLREWGHSISVFALLGFALESELAVLHRFTDLRGDGLSDTQALNQALQEVENLPESSVEEWQTEAKRGSAPHRRSVALMQFHDYDPKLPPLAEALGQLLDRIKYCLIEAKGDLHKWVAEDCPRRRELFPVELHTVAQRKVEGLRALLKPGIEYDLDTVVNLSLRAGIVGRVYGNRQELEKRPLRAKKTDKAIRQQARRALDLLTRSGHVDRSGRGGRGSYTWVLMPGSAAGVGANHQGIAEPKVPQILPPAEPKEVYIQEMKEKKERQSNPPHRQTAKTAPRNMTTPDPHPEQPQERPPSQRKKKDAAPTGKQVRRPFGLIGGVTESDGLDGVVAFGICRRQGKKGEQKKHAIPNPLTRQSSLEVGVISVIPIEVESNWHGPRKMVLVGHLVHGLLDLPHNQALGMGLRDFEVLGSGWVEVRFFVPGGKWLSPTTQNTVLTVSCTVTMRRAEGGTGVIPVGNLKVTAQPLQSREALDLINDFRAKEALDKRNAEYFKAKRAARQLRSAA